MTSIFLFSAYKSHLHICLRCAVFLILLSSGGRTAWCGPLPSGIVLLVPGLRASDLSQPELPSLARLISEGGSGWMVCRAARTTDTRLLRPDGRESDASLLVTLGSGSRALAPLPVPGDGSEVRVHSLQSANSSLDHTVPLGALGDLFHHRSLKTATLGDADASWPDADAWYVAMNAAGNVDFPMTHGSLLPDEKAPFGVRTDVTTLLKDFDAVYPRAGLIVVACAELDRADRYAPYCRPAVAAEQRKAAYRTLNTLLTEILRRCEAQKGAAAVPILLLSPAPAASSDDRTDRLAPIVWWGSGEPAGTLSTASTRRPGLVLNTDVPATFAERLNLPLPPGATGRPFHSNKDPFPPSASALAAHYTEWMRVSRLQNSPGGLPTLQLLLPLLGTVLLFLSRGGAAETRARLRRIVGAIAILVITLPLGMLVLPLLHPSAPWTAETLLAALMLTFGLVAVSRPQVLLPLFRLLAGLLLLLLLLDLPTGTHLLQSAWMSYSVVEGARFYGIGNEYMGVAIGAACVLFGLRGARPETNPPRPGPAPILGFAALFLALILEMGVFGAKVGAIPSAGAAFGVTLLVWKYGRLGLKEIGIVLLLAAIGLGLLAAFDARHAAGDQTHFIRALTGAGGGTLPEILLRKLQLEGWLLLHSAWSPTLLVAAAALLWIKRTSPQLFASRRSHAALLGIGIGAIACLLCNDSGLTAAALLLLYGWAWAALEAASTDSPSTLSVSLEEPVDAPATSGI
jgi:hypothetical protein